ncbi:MAG: DAK2 domain-containing protein [Dehalococcoidia bacterium]
MREVAKAVDAINVYPVPDGDTGSNMAATMREAVDATLSLGPEATAADVLQQLARGALYGARGNSGVIFSQGLLGLAQGAGDCPALDARSLSLGLKRAADAAYAAVSKPVEGTMLTVMRAAATAAIRAADALPKGGEGAAPHPVLDEALRAAEEAEAKTIDQLPELKEAGVPDAGGEGVCVILRGLAAALAGKRPKPPALPDRPLATLAGHEDDRFGFCTEFILEEHAGRLVDVSGMRALAERTGVTSTVIVGDERALRVHVHTTDPEAFIQQAARFGRLVRPKFEDMSQQHGRFRETGSGAGTGVALLALSRGDGFDAIFESLDATIVDLGRVLKPPAGEIARAADALGVPDVIVLPNHKNVVMSARQAAALTRCTVHVVPTESLPQGIAAALACDPDKDVASNVAAMDIARKEVTTVEVTHAAADRTAEGIAVREGQAIALVDDRLVAAEDDVVDALLAGLAHAGAASASLVTIYAGQDCTPADAERAIKRARTAFPGIEVEHVRGGQPLYPLIASVER